MFLYLPLRVYTLYIYFFYFIFILPVGPHANRSSAESLLPYLQFLRALWRLNPCLSFYFSICLCSTMPAPVPSCTLWLQTSPVFGLPLVERRPHYLVLGVWSGRGVSATRFPTHPLPQNGNLDEKMRRMKTKQSAAVRIFVPRGPRGRALLSSKHPLLWDE